MSLLLTIVERLLGEETPVHFEPWSNGLDTYQCSYCRVEEKAVYKSTGDNTPRLFGGLQPPSQPFPHTENCVWLLVEEAGRRFLMWEPAS